MEKHPRLKLVYFKMRALAEAPQLLMHYAGLSYDYAMSWEYYDAPWSEVKPTVMFKQLPILVVDDQHVIAQSSAILRYLNGLAGLSLENPIEAARCDAILEAAQEMFAPLNPTMNFATGDDFEQKKQAMLPMLRSKCDDFERLLAAQGEGPFFSGAKPMHCDFAVYHHISMAQRMHPSILQDFPHLQELLESTSSIPAIQSYLAARPELIGIGTKPQLVINGLPVPTGLTPP